MCHHTREPTVLSRLSCRPLHLNFDRFHQPCRFPWRNPYPLLPPTHGWLGQGQVRTVVPVPRGDHLPLRAARFSLLCGSLEVLPRRLDGTTAGREFILPPLRVPHMEQRCLHTRKFGTLASPPPPVKDLALGTPSPWPRSVVDSLASKIHAKLDLNSLVLPRVSPCLHFLLILQGKGGAIGVSNFLRAFLMVSLNSLSSGSMK